MRKPALYAILLILVGACDVGGWLEILAWTDDGKRVPCSMCTAFGTLPGGNVSVLRGDTFRVATYSDSGLTTAATWLLGGSGIRFLNPDGSFATRIDTPVDTVLTVATALDTSTLTATAGSRISSTRFFVRDSSAVDFLKITTETQSLRVGETIKVMSVLAGQSGPFLTFPVLTISDTSVLRVDHRVVEGA